LRGERQGEKQPQNGEYIMLHTTYFYKPAKIHFLRILNDVLFQKNISLQR
jgi:hypothetical protein